MTSSAIGNSSATPYVSANYLRALHARNPFGTASPNTPRNTDSFSPAAKNQAATYSRATAAAGTPAVHSPSVATWEDRQETAKNYNNILEELRAQYDEPEAMRIFDQVLAADGFERVPEYKFGVDTEPRGYSLYWTTNSNRVNGFAQGPVELNTLSHAEHLAVLDAANGERWSPRNDTNLILQSNMTGASIDGEPQVAAESWAIFCAVRPMSEELRGYWHDRYFDGASAGTDIDLDAYVSTLRDPAQRSVVAVNTDLGGMVSNLLKENGIELREGEYLDLQWNEELDQISVNSSDIYRDFTVLGKVFNNSPALRDAVKTQVYNPPLESGANIPGEYEDGERAVKYSINRNITYSPDEPSAVVVNDFLGVYGYGYSYAKKTGDYFDPGADSFNVRTTGAIPNPATQDMDAYYRDLDEATALVNRRLSEAVETGAVIEGTVSMQAVEDEKNRAAAEREAYFRSQTWYQATSEGAVLIEPGSEPEEPEFDKAHPLPERVEEPPKEEIRYEKERMAEWRKIVERIRSQYFAIDTLIRPPSVAKQ